MNQGGEILLARMDSNPDEFVGMDWPMKSKWDWLLDDLRRRVLPTREDKEREYLPLRFLSKEEVQALWDKLESLRADQFTKAVMRTLLDEESFEEKLESSMSSMWKHKSDATKIVVGRSQYEALKKEFGGSFPSIEDAAYQQIVDDLQALEAAKKRRKK